MASVSDNQGGISNITKQLVVGVNAAIAAMDVPTYVEFVRNYL